MYKSKRQICAKSENNQVKISMWIKHKKLSGCYDIKVSNDSNVAENLSFLE